MSHLSACPLSLLGDEYAAAQRTSSPDRSSADQNAPADSNARNISLNHVTVSERGVQLPSSCQDVHSHSGDVVAETILGTHGTAPALDGNASYGEEVAAHVPLHKAASSVPRLSPGVLVPATAQEKPQAQQYPPALAGIKLAAGGCSDVSSLPNQRETSTRGRSDVNYSSQSSPARIMARGRSLSTNRRQGVNHGKLQLSASARCRS